MTAINASFVKRKRSTRTLCICCQHHLLVALLTAHAIDIKYHKSCWAKHVTRVLRKTIKVDKERSRSETAAKLEFLNLTQAALDSGEILNMAQLEQAFDSISNESNSPKTLILSK